MNISVRQTYFTGSVHLFEYISCYPTLALELRFLQTAHFFCGKVGHFLLEKTEGKEGKKSLSALAKKTPNNQAF